MPDAEANQQLRMKRTGLGGGTRLASGGLKSGESVSSDTFYFAPRRERLRLVFHRLDVRVEMHVLLAFVSHCLLATLKKIARSHAPDLTPRTVIEKFTAIQIADVHLPTLDGRKLVLPRYT